MAEKKAVSKGISGGVPRTETDRLRARAVWLYFVEDKTQNEIAKILGINRIAIVRLLAEAKRRNEVRITISAPLADLSEIERGLEERYGIPRAIVAPFSEQQSDPTKVIAAAAGAYINSAMQSGMTVGVGWGRTLHNTLPFIAGKTLEDFKVVSLLGGIAAARRFNPAEFAWQFAELFQGEGFLIPAPALVDSPETKRALLEKCGLAEIFEMASDLDIAIISVGGIATITTSYRIGHISETERKALVSAGAVGDILYNFIDVEGRLVDHPVNKRAISIDLEQLRRARSRVLASGGREKVQSLLGAINVIRPTVLITDEMTARELLKT
ncbi:Deoxyribonucleoside regulator [Agrobacterium fabrum str. J-07]|uniref:sugar-binding transcriptional regulator n=1 Tax=Agrobacterium fabrum TaxID=1176649 RepID=UPI0009CF472D|nr:sugar-binding transcriptional regulator [Agrobacterium fabrum]CUX58414.1 Deoxyribonucleoside regulator [Agrobacterium fabrum str. J-07]